MGSRQRGQMYHTRHALVTRVLSLYLIQLQNQVQMYLHEQHQGKHGPWNIWVRTIHTLCTEIAHETEGRKQNNEQPGESPSDLYSAQKVWSSTQRLRKAWEPFTVTFEKGWPRAYEIEMSEWSEQWHFFLFFIMRTVQVKEKAPCPFQFQNSNLGKMKQGKGKFVDSKYV